MRYSISDTAEYGDFMVGKRIITKDTRQEMKSVLSEIQDGTFAREWLTENKNGRPLYNRIKEDELGHQMVDVGKNLRRMMSWIKE